MAAERPAGAFPRGAWERGDWIAGCKQPCNAQLEEPKQTNCISSRQPVLDLQAGNLSEENKGDKSNYQQERVIVVDSGHATYTLD
jgi:hypothetical protein